jgi:hypothetical protein
MILNFTPVAFSGASRYLLTVSADTTAHVWDVATGSATDTGGNAGARREEQPGAIV